MTHSFLHALIAILACVAPPEERAPDRLPDLRVDRGAGLIPLYVPRDEALQFDVEIDIGIAEVDVGDVELSSGVDPYISGLPDASANAPVDIPKLERGWVRSTARGSYLSYRLEHELKTRILPQSFPAVFYTDTQRGSENRNRELKLGVREGELRAEFRSDGHCKGCTNREHFNEPKWVWGSKDHCKKCKKLEHRVFKPAVSRVIPAGTLDMLSAVYLARTLIRDKLPETTFPVIDQQKIWEVTLAGGKTKRIKTEAGIFDCQLVQLSTKFLAEENDPEAEENRSHFAGLFGIQGTIQIWLERNTGVPVLIEGELPIPLPFVDKLDVRVRLKSYTGVPPEFRVLERK